MNFFFSFQVFDVIYSVFHMHGAVEIETPVFELKVCGTVCLTFH